MTETLQLVKYKLLDLSLVSPVPPGLLVSKLPDVTSFYLNCSGKLKSVLSNVIFSVVFITQGLKFVL